MKAKKNDLLQELQELLAPVAWEICTNEFPHVCKKYSEGIPIVDEDEVIRCTHSVDNLEKAIDEVANSIPSMFKKYSPKDLGPFFLGVCAGYEVSNPIDSPELQLLTDVFMATLSRRNVRELHSLNYLLLRHIVLWHMEEEALGEPLARLSIFRFASKMYSSRVDWDLVLFREAELLYVYCLASGLVLPRYIVRRDEELGWVLECLDHEIPESLSTPGWIPKTIR